ncbi:IS110 family transposase [Tessaracoccus lubricantis]|uniref:IS110 family transposase n=1 Tax=Tessaracoccus lubricantis TaxID=545543 RepID=A0ABP9F049_9ACTN
MSIIAHTCPFIIGVDAHARSHALAILACPTGEILDEGRFPTTAAGLQRAIAWASRRTEGDLDTLWVVEGVGTYGARLAHAAADAGYAVVEAPRMNARANRGVGKSDPLDARRIAQAVLPLTDVQLRRPRRDDGARAALRVLIASRDHITNERTAAINALIAILRVVDLGIDARGTLTAGQISAIAAWRSRTEELSLSVARAEAVRLARRVRSADQELSDLTRRMRTLLEKGPAAGLLDKPGIGPVTAAIAYAAWSHTGRVRSEAAFASLAGVNPIPASSGNTIRHRINRGGDRRLNRALHMAVVTRMRMDPDTRAYVEKRTAEGRTLREIRRSLKRYLARQIYRHLNSAQTAHAGA